MSQESTTEKKLAEIWRQVLNLSAVGVDEDFLDLGGDSLSARSCISRIESEFGIEFMTEDFFINPATVSTFAVIVDRLNKDGAVSDQGLGSTLPPLD